MAVHEKRLFTGIAFALGAVMLAPAAQAQATRTWVSGVGDDVNPCSRTAPCKTFAGAISKTAAGGEINCLDPGGWGAVTITKSITIDCSQFPGGILNTSGNGININAGISDAVVLRGLEVTGVGSSYGSSGIRITQVGSVTLENVTIRYQVQGINFIPTNASRLNLINVSILNTAVSAPAAASCSSRAPAARSLRRCRAFASSQPECRAERDPGQRQCAHKRQ